MSLKIFINYKLAPKTMPPAMPTGPGRPAPLNPINPMPGMPNPHGQPPQNPYASQGAQAAQPGQNGQTGYPPMPNAHPNPQGGQPQQGYQQQPAQHPAAAQPLQGGQPMVAPAPPSIGENGEKEREKLRLELQETHELFRDFVSDNRPQLDIKAVSTGEHWYGKQALELNLVDELMTSDEFLVNALNEFDIYELSFEIKQGLQDKLLSGLFSSLGRAKNSLAKVQNNAKFK